MTFASQLSVAFTPISAVYEDASITQALFFAQSEVEGYTGRTFDLTTDDVVHLTPGSNRTAILPGIPVISVTQVRGLVPLDNSVAWTVLTNYRFVPETGLIYDTTGEPGSTIPSYPSWPWVPGSLEVTYTHGYSTVPRPLIDVACRFAQQYLENPALMMQRRIGEQEGRYAGSKGVVITELDQYILDRYRDIGLS